MVKNPPVMQERYVQSLSWEHALGEEMATQSNILARTEESRGLQSTELQRVRHN